MEMTSSRCCYIWLVLFLCFPFVRSFNDSLSESLDVLLHDHPFKTLFHGRPRTGALYNATLPANLTGMKVTAIRLRSRTLWRMGANLTNVCIPPRTHPIPYVRRLLIVYHDLGNWSSIYNNVPEKPILIQFNSSISPTGSNPSAKCASFDAYGRVKTSEMSFPNVCQTRTLGYFFIETPSVQKKVWIFWVLGFVLGFLCLFFVVLLIGAILMRALTVKRTHDMEREADEGEVLHTFWVNSSKMPRATITRTRPVLENPGRP